MPVKAHGRRSEIVERDACLAGRLFGRSLRAGTYDSVNEVARTTGPQRAFDAVRAISCAVLRRAEFCGSQAALRLFSRISARISLAATGIFVPGPKMADAPDFFRKS